MNQLSTCAKLLTGVKFAKTGMTRQCAVLPALSRVSTGSLRHLGQIIVWAVFIASAAIMLSTKPARAAGQYEYCTLSCSASAPATGSAGTAVNLSASATTVYCDGEPNYQWSFGDNTTSSGSSVSHTYASPGTYSWSLTISIGSTTCNRSGQITISGRASTLASVSAASYSGSRLASDSIVAAFGTGLATATMEADTVPLPNSLAGTSVKVKDSANVERVASLFFVAPAQINYLIPRETAVGTATVTLTSGDGSTATGTMQIAAVAPGLFAANSSGQGVAAASILRIKADGARSDEPVAQYDTAQKKFVTLPIDLGPETDQVFLILFGTGIQGRSSLSAVTASIGGTNSEVLFAGPQGRFVGLDQVNLRLPRSLIGRGEIDIALTVDGQPANIMQIKVQ
ncbi:MAG: PKD domain-containing protein [Acidobacteria bacterium]|nr:PKD domain-containing protein [Acidobacteriota bacterium]